VDVPELRPATRKRARPDVRDAQPPHAEDRSGGSEVVAHLLAIESAVRAVDVRVEALEREHRSSVEALRALVIAGFDEASSRALVLSEVADETASRHDRALEELGRDVGAATDAVSRTADAVTRTSDAVGAVGLRIVSLERAVDRVAELHSSMSTLLSQSRAITEAIESLDARLTALEHATEVLPSLEAVPTNVDEIQRVLVGIGGDLASVRTSLAGLEPTSAALVALESASERVAGEVRNAIDAVAHVEATLATLVTQIEGAGASVAAVEARFTPLQAVSDTVTELKAVLAALVSEVERNQEVVVDRVSDVESLLKKARIRPVLRAGDDT